MNQTDESLPAIPAAHHPLGSWLVTYGLILWSLWSSFDRIRVHVEAGIPDPRQGPCIFYQTHVSWWDGYLARLLDLRLLQGRYQSYVMMEQAQLQQYRFFSWVGAFSVHRQDPQEATRSINYISQILHQQPGSALWIYPQGLIVPPERRPLQIYPGIGRIVRQVGTLTMVPIAYRFAFRREQRPEALIWFGAPYQAQLLDSREQADDVQRRLTQAADQLAQAATAERFDTFVTLMRGSPGVNRVFDATLGRLLP